MAAKTIAVDAEAYRLLASAKRPGETFSEVVKRTMRPRRPLADFAGAWKDVSREELAAVKATISEGRRLDLVRQKSLDELGR